MNTFQINLLEGPCTVTVLSVTIEPPQPNNDASDWDNKGYKHVDFIVTDSEGEDITHNLFDHEIDTIKRKALEQHEDQKRAL